MYNKLFTKILDSSIWLEPTATRIVWLTLIAAMDENGFAQFASIANLAHRAVLPVDDSEKAVKTLEAPDANSSDPEFEGRRIERVPGGWMILNADKYRELVTRAIIQEQTRKRVAEHRKRNRNDTVTACNAPVTQANENVTASDTDSEALSKSKSESETKTDLKDSGRVRNPVSENPPGTDAVLDYAKDNPSAVLRTDVCMAWMDARARDGWKIKKAGHLYEFYDWRADLRGFHRSYLQNDADRKARTVHPKGQKDALGQREGEIKTDVTHLKIRRI